MRKFNRVYSLSVEVGQGVITSENRRNPSSARNVEITLPYTVEFVIERRTLTSAQRGTFKVYNLGADVRAAIQKDVFDYTDFRAIQFRAGYQSPEGWFRPLVFNGSVLTCYSYREGKDWITEIEAFDGGWQMANANSISQSVAPGTSSATTITQLAKQLGNMSGTPIVGDFPATNLRGEALFGNAWTLITQKSNGLAFIDNGQVKALNYNEVFRGPIPVISAETGLLGSPKRTTSSLEFDMIFEPRLTVGQLVEVQSVANPQFNRPWKVLGFEHRGIISPAVAGDCLTSVRLWFTPEDLRIIQGTPVQ